MDYIDITDIEHMNSIELLDYYKKLKKRKDEMLIEISMWANSIKKTKLALIDKINYIEFELLEAELDRLDFDNDIIAFNNTLTTVN